MEQEGRYSRWNKKAGEEGGRRRQKAEKGKGGRRRKKELDGRRKNKDDSPHMRDHRRIKIGMSVVQATWIAGVYTCTYANCTKEGLVDPIDGVIGDKEVRPDNVIAYDDLERISDAIGGTKSDAHAENQSLRNTEDEGRRPWHYR